MSICEPTMIVWDCISKTLKYPIYILFGIGVIGWINFIFKRVKKIRKRRKDALESRGERE